MKVITFGTFDPLHKGHENFLKQAKKLGSLVVVVAHHDKIRQEKNRNPRETDSERIAKVKNLKIADKVILGEKGIQFGLLEKINPDIIALGYDQKIPEPLKNKVKKYKIVSLKPYKPEIYKSSKIATSNQPPASSNMASSSSG
ncbi:MAG: adenylyltransferase/cytidyltransferase family protein [Candidatus Berkelbacteria bacterium]|nr:adenylyltransferase/cytidyltransferase family protein [Candidatus Berkelbacteria bacterium]